ncbi:MAG: SycD/LcrH family type III secretion system chaperone [Chlamydiales bacterium]|nr:SycD/LcrH family type III secretion system chaperone [Chlamydiia bacterium]MCP5507665.1 SycD/LcrH family type III secretion system chaperone [Chlamydiales bacterium]
MTNERLSISNEIQDLVKQLAADESGVSAIAELSQESKDALYAVAYSHYQSGKYKEAVVFFQLLTGVDTLNASYWKGLAATFQMMKDFERAVEAYSIVAIFDEKEVDPMPHYHAAQCLHSLGQLERGMQALKSANAVAKKDKKYQELLPQIKLQYKSWSKQLNN